MKIEINITKNEKEHLRGCNSKYDACGYVQRIIKKVERALKKESKNVMMGK